MMLLGILPWGIVAQTVTSMSPVNTPSTGGLSLTVTGSGFAGSDTSPKGRIEFTACEASVWVSDVAVICKGSQGFGRSLGVIVSVAQVQGNKTRVLSYDSPVVSLTIKEGIERNSPVQGNVSITVHGAHFGASSTSPSARIGGSACQATNWKSASSVVCRVRISTFSFVVCIVSDVGPVPTELDSCPNDARSQQCAIFVGLAEFL